MLSEFLFNTNKINYMVLFMYIFILEIIGMSNIYLLIRLFRSIKDLNEAYEIIPLDEIKNLKTDSKVSILFLFAIVAIIVYAVLYFINRSIYSYVFDEKISFAWQTKICAYICVCFLTSLSILLFLLYAYYIVFLSQILTKSCEDCICIYPISKEIFYKIKREVSIANYIYWLTIVAYVFFVFFHLYVYHGLNLTLQLNHTNFEIVWFYIAVIALLGYFVFFYFPNKLIYDNVLKIKLQTIKEIEEKSQNELYNNDLMNLLQLIYNSPSMFNQYFLNRLFPTITTIATILISLIQLSKGVS